MSSNPSSYSAPSVLRITHHTHVPPASMIFRPAHGNDEIEGRRVREELLCGRGRMEMEDAGFEGILDGVVGVAGKLVEEVVRY